MIDLFWWKGPYLAGTACCTHLCFGLPSKYYEELTLGEGFGFLGISGLAST